MRYHSPLAMYDETNATSPPDPESRLRAANLVFTVQRRAIWDAFRERRDHPTADELFDVLDGERLGASRTTVYRTLETFVRLGLAQRVGHLGSAARYDPRTLPHDHVVCEVCGMVRDVDLGDRPTGSAIETIPGFAVRAVTRLARGRCDSCRDVAEMG